MVGPILVVLVIAHGTSEPLPNAFERAARGALGSHAELRIRTVASDPSDEEAVSLAGNADGVVELSWEKEGAKARLHCYVVREKRWVDREITFGEGASSEHEAGERGRLLGFAVATMFDRDEHPESFASPQAAAAAIDSGTIEPSDRRDARVQTRAVEFAGAVGSGIGGKASGLGAEGAVRWVLHGPLWARVFVGGRFGSIPEAQATTRSASLGGGVAFAALPTQSRLSLGLRADAFVSYFEATHLSEDDLVPDRRSRWLAGGDLFAEGGYRFVGSAGVFLGAGIEALLGKTAIYTHGQRVATVAPVRLIGQLGLRVGF